MLYQEDRRGQPDAAAHPGGQLLQAETLQAGEEGMHCPLAGTFIHRWLSIILKNASSRAVNPHSVFADPDPAVY